MSRPTLLLFGVLVFLALSAAQSSKRTLVILDDLVIKDTHSIFFKSLADRGYSLTYSEASADITLKKYGEFQYDNLIIFAPKAEEYGRLTSAAVVDFIDGGNNVFIAAGPTASEALRDIASECGVEFDEDGTAVMDHFHYDASDADGRHTLITSTEYSNTAPVIVGSAPITKPFVFRGLAHTIRDSTLNYLILSAHSTAFSGSLSSSTKAPTQLGRKIALVSALQARNSARVIFSGSLEAFADTQLSQSGTGNQQLAVELTKWAFHERGILRARNSHHAKADGTTPPMYTVKDLVDYSVVIEEWDGAAAKWRPYIAKDVQLEFVRLDPYIRTTLQGDSQGKYSTQLTVPDVYGFFTFKVDYRRPGYSPLNVIDRIPVRPFRHDQYERFIASAFPYYAGAFSVIAGLFVFSVVFLFHDDRRK